MDENAQPLNLQPVDNHIIDSHMVLSPEVAVLIHPILKKRLPVRAYPDLTTRDLVTFVMGHDIPGKKFPDSAKADVLNEEGDSWDKKKLQKFKRSELLLLIHTINVL